MKVRRHIAWSVVSSIAVFLFSGQVSSASSTPQQQQQQDSSEDPPSFDFFSSRGGGGAPFSERVEKRMEEIQRDMEVAKRQLERDMEVAKGNFRKDIQRTIRSSRRRFRDSVHLYVFQQRIGWNRLRYSIRDHLGFIFGCWVVFRGYTSHYLGPVGGGSLAFQSGKLGWFLLNLTGMLPHQPWVQDSVSVVLALLTWKNLSRMSPQVKDRLPPIFLGLNLAYCWDLVLQEWNSTNELQTPLWSVILAVGLSILGLKAGKIPLPLAASSLSGAMLVYQSAREEIRGNWLYMIRSIAWPVYGLLPVVRNVLYYAGRGAKWMWSLRKSLPARVLDSIRHRWLHFKSGLEKFTEFVSSPLHRVVLYFQDLTVTLVLQENLQQLRMAMRRIWWPLAIATWGVAVQMKYGLPYALHYLVLTVGISIGHPLDAGRNCLLHQVNDE